MLQEELIEENKQLKEEIQQLRQMLENKILTRTTTAYGIISNLITNKVDNEVHEDFKHCKQTIKRAIMEDLKWELHVRYANDFQKEHIESARQFINNYEINDLYKNRNQAKVGV